MIKRMLSIGMIMTIMFLSVSIVYAVEKTNGTTTVDNDKMIAYLNSDSKKRLLLRDNYGYMACIEKFNSDVTFLYLLNMSDLFINSGTKPDKNKYMEVLINIIASYDLDSADDISKQKEMDNLKSFKDYALDCAEMGAQAVSVMTGISSSTSQLEEGISTAVDGLSVLSNNTDNWIEALTNLETIVQDYSAHSEFLELVAEKAEDSDLKDAANTLRGSLSKAIKIKLETYSNISNENFENYEEFFFSDGLFAAIKQTPDYASDESLKFFTECGEKVFILKDAWDLGVSIGKMVGNVVAGGEDLINRVLEMMALHDISDILVNGLFETESKVVSNIYNNNSDGVTNYINLSQYLIMTRIRGEYCLYSIVAKDTGLLSWFNKESQEDAKKWYDNKAKKLSAIQEELLAVNDTKTNEYTALNLIDKSLSEIVELMGNDYQLNKQQFSTAFGSDPVLMIYNEATMPGLAVCPSYSSGIYQDIENGVNAREKIQQGSYTYDGIAVYGSGKLNENISADMTYNDLATEIGDFDTQGVGQETLVYTTEMDGYKVSYYFSTYEYSGLSDRIKNGKITSADMKAVNPKINSIAIFKDKNNTDNSSSNKSIEVRENDTLSLSGTLATEDYVTNTGDKKTVTILNLDKPIDCYLYADGFYDGKTKYTIESVQLDVTFNLRKTIGNHIAIQGKVMLAHTIHHRRDIIICDISETSDN